jgi:SAM-dependent methyltransferase
MRKRRISPVQFCVLLYGALICALTAAHFPYHTDPEIAASDRKELKAFYSEAYDSNPKPEDAAYVTVATEAADRLNVKGAVEQFVQAFHLENKKVLDVGAGRGYLQDIVPNNMGLDISPTARRFFHKPFVLGSATSLPFKDGEFDAIWTIWVLEHVPNPEQALSEMRRVLKPGGLLYLAPAWFCNSWAAQGYLVRPYSDFGPAGKIVKASIPLQMFSTPFYMYPTRLLRMASARVGGPARFHYNLLIPNYDRYYQSDSDALNAMDPLEAMLWFQSRGDRCLNCGSSLLDELALQPIAMVIQRL